MIIVAGMPRSGTSILMRICFYLDYHVCGNKFPVNRVKAINPNGFFEDPKFFIGDYSRISQDEDFVVKTHLRKLIERVKLSAAIHKVILCTRDIDAMTQSQMTNNVNTSSTYDRQRIQNVKWYGKFSQYIGTVPYLTVNLDDLKANKNAGVTAIKNFIGATREVDTAVGIIEP